LQVTGFPADAVPHVTVTTTGWPVTVTEAVPCPVAPVASVAVAVTVSEPLAEYVVVKPVPVPVAGLPLGADHEIVNAPVPPAAEALQATGLPTVAEPQLTPTVIVTVVGVTVTSCVAVAVTPFASTTTRNPVKVLVDVTL